MDNREYQKAVDYLTDRIGKKEWKVGDRLPTERSLAQTLGIGRNSTREALRTLENMGLVECRQGSGHYLADHLTRTLSGALDRLLLLRGSDRQDLVVFRKNMEKAVCLALLEQESLDRWLPALEEALLPAEDPGEQAENDCRFHLMLIRATENEFWVSLSQALAPIYRKWIGEVSRNAASEVKQGLDHAHAALLQSLVKKDRQGMEAAIEAHYKIVEEELKTP